MHFLKKDMNVNNLLSHYPAHLNPMFSGFSLTLLCNTLVMGKEVPFILLFVMT